MRLEKSKTASVPGLGGRRLNQMIIALPIFIPLLERWKTSLHAKMAADPWPLSNGAFCDCCYNPEMKLSTMRHGEICKICKKKTNKTIVERRRSCDVFEFEQVQIFCAVEEGWEVYRHLSSNIQAPQMLGITELLTTVQTRGQLWVGAGQAHGACLPSPERLPCLHSTSATAKLRDTEGSRHSFVHTWYS